MKKTVCIDFDGAIHRYSSGWKGETVIPDGIVDGAAEAISKLSGRYEICIYTTRANTPEGHVAVQRWLTDHGVCWNRVEGKPIAVAYVDDRAVLFREGQETWDETVDAVDGLA